MVRMRAEECQGVDPTRGGHGSLMRGSLLLRISRPCPLARVPYPKTNFEIHIIHLNIIELEHVQSQSREIVV